MWSWWWRHYHWCKQGLLCLIASRWILFCGHVITSGWAGKGCVESQGCCFLFVLSGGGSGMYLSSRSYTGVGTGQAVHAVLWGDIGGNEWLSQRKAIKQLIIKSYEKGLFVKDESSENISWEEETLRLWRWQGSDAIPGIPNPKSTRAISLEKYWYYIYLININSVMPSIQMFQWPFRFCIHCLLNLWRK